ncbi:MAG: hypothetical protein GY821_02630 [Gammaproteobacteria bacterium]|nr:hypothetical protein [Gammaproteobacteria bacterium]
MPTDKSTSRLIRLRDAPAYLGIDKHSFNKKVRPAVKAIPIGKSSFAFDRLDLDAWIKRHR